MTETVRFASVMFNGSPYNGVVLRETATRLLVRFTTGTGWTRESWFRRVERPVGILRGRRSRLGPGEVTIPANSGFITEGASA